MYEKPPDGCENSLLGPTPQVHDSESVGGAQDHVFLSCSQVMLLLLVWNHTVKTTVLEEWEDDW